MVSFLLAVLIDDSLGIPAFLLAVVTLFILLEKYAFKGGRDSVEKVNQLVRAAVAEAKAG